MNEAVICEHIRFDNLGVVEKDLVTYNANSNFGLVQSSNDLPVTKVVGVGNFVEGMSSLKYRQCTSGWNKNNLQ
jgi:hypothetical protein